MPYNFGAQGASQQYTPAKDEAASGLWNYNYQEPSTLGQYFLQQAKSQQGGTPNSDPSALLGLSVKGVLGSSQWGNPKFSAYTGASAYLDPSAPSKFTDTTFGDWLTKNNLQLSSNPYYNGDLLSQFANANGATLSNKFGTPQKTTDDFGRPLVWGRNSTITYSGDPSKPETWNPQVNLAIGGQTPSGSKASTAYNAKTGSWDITVNSPASADGSPASTNTSTLFSTQTPGMGGWKQPWAGGAGTAPATTTPRAAVAPPGGTPNPFTVNRSTSLVNPTTAASSMSPSMGISKNLTPATGMDTLNSSLAGQKGLQQGQDLADYMRSFQTAYQPTGNPNYQFTRNPRLATDLMPWSGSLPATQLPGPGQQTPGLKDLIAAKAAGQTGPGVVPTVNTPNPQFTPSASGNEVTSGGGQSGISNDTLSSGLQNQSLADVTNMNANAIGQSEAGSKASVPGAPQARMGGK